MNTNLTNGGSIKARLDRATSSSSINLDNYYTKQQTYNKDEVDNLIDNISVTGGVSPTIAVNTNNDTTYTLDITDKNGTITTPNLKGSNGTNGTNGADGISPTISVKTNTDTEYVLEITDTNGTITTPNLKGQDGQSGTGGTSSYTLPIASATTLGGIKVGDNLTIDANGVLSANVSSSGGGGSTSSDIQIIELDDTCFSGGWTNLEGSKSFVIIEGNKVTVDFNLTNTTAKTSVTITLPIDAKYAPTYLIRDCGCMRQSTSNVAMNAMIQQNANSLVCNVIKDISYSNENAKVAYGHYHYYIV